MVRIKSIGIELEGGVSLNTVKQLRQKYGENFSYAQDGSVCVSFRGEDWVPCAELRYWTLREEINKLYDFIRQAFNLGLRQNDTCGNHVHISLYSKKDLMLVSYLGFWKYFKHEVRKWNDERVNGRFENRYCRGVYRCGYESYAKCPMGRYFAINFEARFKHRDDFRMEVRLLPYADNASQLIRWVSNLVSIIEDFPPVGKRIVLTEREGIINMLSGERREVVNLTNSAIHYVIELPTNLKREIKCAL